MEQPSDIIRLVSTQSSGQLISWRSLTLIVKIFQSGIDCLRKSYITQQNIHTN